VNGAQCYCIVPTAEKMSYNGASLGWHAAPKPELHGIVTAEALHGSGHTPAGIVGRAVGLIAGKCLGGRSFEIERDPVTIAAIVVVPRGVKSDRTFDLVATPVRERFGRQHGLCVRPVSIHKLTAVFAGDLFQQTQYGLDNLRFGGCLQPCRACSQSCNHQRCC